MDSRQGVTVPKIEFAEARLISNQIRELSQRKSLDDELLNKLEPFVEHLFPETAHEKDARPSYEGVIKAGTQSAAKSHRAAISRTALARREDTDLGCASSSMASREP